MLFSFNFQTLLIVYSFFTIFSTLFCLCLLPLADVAIPRGWLSHLLNAFYCFYPPIQNHSQFHFHPYCMLFFCALFQTMRLLCTTSFHHPSNPSLFPDHHSLYLLPLQPKNRAPCPLHLIFYRQHISTSLFLNCSHTSVPLPQKLPTFQLPNLTSNFCNSKILHTLCPFKRCWRLGANSLTNFFMR